MSEEKTSQASRSKSTEQLIEIEPKPSGPHNGKEITKLLLSPNKKYAVTWSKEDDSVYGWPLDIDGWPLDKDQPIEFDYFINVKDFCKNLDPQLSAVSNDKLVAIESINEFLYRYGIIEIIHLVTNKVIQLETLYLDKPIAEICLSGCKFYNNGGLVVGAQTLNTFTNKTYYEIFIFAPFSSKNLHSCGSLTQWNLKTLLFEKQYQLEWNEIWALHPLKSDLCSFNKTFTLLAICLQVLDCSETDTFISVYLTENAILLSQYKIKYENDRTLSHLEFISSDDGERLILFYDDYNLEIRDPYHLQHCFTKTIPSLCKELSTLNGETFTKFKTLTDEKIYSIRDGRLYIQELSRKHWIKYLREKLVDQNEIRTLPSKPQIEDILKTILSENEDQNDDDYIRKKMQELYEGSLVKWTVTSGGRVINAQKFDSTKNEWKSLEWKIYPEHLREPGKPARKFVYRCDLLNNEDLLVITSIGLLILSVWQKNEIRLRYYKGFPFKSSFLREKDIKKRMISGYIEKETIYKRNQFFAKKSTIQKLLNELQNHEKCTLPPPDFDAITPYYEDLCMDGRYPFKELLNDYIQNEITMALYGQELLKSFLKNKDHQMMEKLYAECIKINIKSEKDNFIANLKLLEIISFSINDLSVKSPDLLDQFLSHSSFTLSSMEKELAVGRFSTKSHLQNHRKYLQLSNSYYTTKIVTLYENIKAIIFTFLEEKNYRKRPEENPALVLIFPLPKFSSYTKNYNPWKELLFPNSSPFCDYEYSELYKWWNGQALINFKWNTYGKYYFLAIWIFYVTFMCCFLVVVTISNELSQSTQESLLITTIILGVLHLGFELRQFIYSPSSWISDPWNYFDVLAILLPISTSISWLESSEIPLWDATISTLFLEIKFLAFFRMVEITGAYFAMIIGVAQSVFSFLVILGFFVFTFAHSLHILLRPITNFSLSQPSNSNDPNDPWNLVTAYYSISEDRTVSKNATLTEIPNTSTNMFTNLYTAVLAFLAEIELFYMLPYQRRKNNWFPEIIFYRFHIDEFLDIIKKIKNNKWDGINDKPFLSETLLEHTNIKMESEEEKVKDISHIINEKIQDLKNNDEKSIRELKKFFSEEIEKLKTIMSELREEE
ncbi:transient receptor potential cation channel subfamily a member 1-like [Gigaspora margarita]|uniref:Transient receptor potential cation channel subfamily a member 1-like n=1 Tax=Gigaspora margarita TaxID=4874 RepID=A0A8H4AAN4_GIGMA|nr:transient receptor potential cation channel subfamily a member 1-like [Gigaspora margarita]